MEKKRKIEENGEGNGGGKGKRKIEKMEKRNVEVNEEEK